MFRDTLEMIPVAIIMTLILSFGMRTGRAPTFSHRPPPAAALGAAILATPGPAAVACRGDGGGAAVAAADDAEIEAAAPPPLFIERLPRTAGVPFYTSRDIIAFQREHGRTSLAAAVNRPARRPPAEHEPRPAPNSARRRVALNRATLGELRLIPGIGPVKAQALIERRPQEGYKSWQELDLVPGIGAGMIATMKIHATLD